MQTRYRLLAAPALLFSATPAIAQDGTDTAPPEQPAATDNQGDDFHGRTIFVTADRLDLDILAGTSVVEGVALQRNLDGQVGEVLTSLPGVSATGFAPGASRPILRGFQGDRVRVLVDGIGAIDASNTSADHAVTIDPLTAARIEVVRGPAVLLYGSSAIGGAVNVIDKRIPIGVPEEAFHLDVIGGLDTAYDLRETGASLDLALSSNWVAHFDGSFRQTDDFEAPSYILAPELRADLRAEAVEEPDEADELLELADRKGEVPSTFTETWSLGSGIAWIGDGANFGVAGGYYDTEYGVPTRPGAGHHHGEEEGEGAEEEEEGEESVSIGLSQWRADMRGGFDFGGGPFAAFATRWGYSNYEHTEFEGDEVGTVFEVEGIEGRAELAQRRRGRLTGSTGAQYLWRDFVAIGEEAFVPANKTNALSLFTLQKIDLAPLSLEIGGRYEHTKVATDDLTRKFDTFSGALGLAYEVRPEVRIGANLSRAARAPTAEELFADGPHIATQQFEIGDPGLDQETAVGLEGYVRGSIGDASFALTAYHTWFDDFVVLQATGLEEDELPVYRREQQDAKHYGFEAEAIVPLASTGPWQFAADLNASYVRATLADGSPVPRIPPLSLLAALDATSDRFEARAQVQWFAQQDRVTAFETPTDSFAMVQTSLAWKPLRGNDNLTVMAKIDNLFDATGRRHASYTKDFVPLAGRNAKLSVSLSL